MISAAPTDTEIPITAIDAMIVEIDNTLTRQMVEIISNPRFEALRDAWYGVSTLISAIAHVDNAHIDILPISREDIQQDFDENPDLTTSAMWFHAYTSEYDVAGGQPYDAFLLQWWFNHFRDDLLFLKKLSQIAAGCHCPVITNPSPRLFQLDHFNQMEEIQDYKALFESMDYKRWRSLRTNPDSRFLAMVVPGAVQDMPMSRRPQPRWCRDKRLAKAYRTRIHGSLLFGVLLANSFHQWGWTVQVRGPKTGGLTLVPEQITHHVPGLTLNSAPTEVAFSDARERELAEQGFIVLNYYRAAERACVFSAPTLQNPNKGDQYDRLAASLPYVLLISRIAHYQRVIQRENIGSMKTSKELERELTKWMEHYITRATAPNQDQRAKRPLGDGSRVEVFEDDSNPGYFNVRLIIRPHIQLEGVSANLTLVSKMPKQED